MAIIVLSLFDMIKIMFSKLHVIITVLMFFFVSRSSQGYCANKVIYLLIIEIDTAFDQQ